jgi:hypothetical protein
VPTGDLFAQLTMHRYRALAALWVSTGARAAELLGPPPGDIDARQQLITKGTRLMQQLAASPEEARVSPLARSTDHGGLFACLFELVDVRYQY